MRYRLLILLSSITLGFAPLALLAQGSTPAPAGLGCDQVTSTLGRNLTSLDWQEHRRAFAYDYLCKAKRESSSSGERLMVKIITEEFIGVDGSGERSKESVKQFCKESVELEDKQQLGAYFQSTVVVPAIAAWEACKRYEAYNVIVVPEVSADGRLLAIAIENRTRSADLRFLEVYGSDQSAKCVRAGGGSTDEPFPLPQLRTVGIRCVRNIAEATSASGEKYQYVPAVTFSLFTEASSAPLLLSLPAIKFPGPHLTSEEGQALEAKLQRLQGRLDELTAAFTAPQIFGLSSAKTVKGSVGPNAIGKHSFCALSWTQDVHGDQGCGCLVEEKEGVWYLSALKERVTGQACHCRALCLSAIN